jgi:hypothetical protein
MLGIVFLRDAFRELIVGPSGGYYGGFSPL